MKKLSIFSLATILTLGFAACSNEAGNSTTGNADSTGTTAAGDNETAAAATTATSTGNYAAMADSFRTNSEAGNYVDPRTGKSIRISVDPQTGAKLNAETNEPVTRYVDRRSWWVYDASNDQQIGEARMDKGTLKFKGENDQWVDYDMKWKVDEGDGEVKG
ncbi:MAG TPA: hypothetical protein VHK69_02210, partial [Chitinophagaceae bacterium]|nr:hypothetical protein [Chitinophagaceae bacterium]